MDTPSGRENLGKLSPINHAENVKSPILVVHGAKDPRVPVASSDRMVEAMSKQGVNVWSLRAANEGHGVGRPDNSEFITATTIAFVKKFLLENKLPEAKVFDSHLANRKHQVWQK